MSTKITPIYNFENYIKIAKHTLQVAHQAACRAIEHFKQITKNTYDKKIHPTDFEVGDSFLIKSEPYNKFKNIYTGPYIVKMINEPNITYEHNGKENCIHKNRVVKCN